MKKTTLISLLLLYFVLYVNSAYSQCKSAKPESLNKLMKFHFDIPQPQNITFNTRPSSIYEIMLTYYGYCSFVKADGVPYFYLWTSNKKHKDHGPHDNLKDDPIYFYLKGNKVIESKCLMDYIGIEDQAISFYPLQVSDLELLASTPIDSIKVFCHPQIVAKNKKNIKPDTNTLKFSKHISEKMMGWASCLKGEF